MSGPAHKAKGDLLARAAEAQRRNGRLPDSRADEAIWSGLLERMDRQAADAKAARPKPDRNPARSAARALERDGAELLDSRSARRAVRSMTPRRGRRSAEAVLACRRLELLKLSPEWQQQVIAAMNEGARKAIALGSKDMRLLIWVEVRKVLDASNKLFGRWDRPPERKVTVSG